MLIVLIAITATVLCIVVTCLIGWPIYWVYNRVRPILVASDLCLWCYEPIKRMRRLRINDGYCSDACRKNHTAHYSEEWIRKFWVMSEHLKRQWAMSPEVQRREKIFRVLEGRQDGNN